MEDIRFKNTNDHTFTMLSFFIFLKKNWIKILIILLVLSIIIFPTFFGTIIGNWLFNFVNAFSKKYILTLCL